MTDKTLKFWSLPLEEENFTLIIIHWSPICIYEIYLIVTLYAKMVMSNFKRVPLTGTICSFSAKEENDLIFQNFDQIKVARVALYIGQYTIFAWRITCAYSPFSTKLLNSMLLCAHNTPKIHIKLCILFIQILS